MTSTTRSTGSRRRLWLGSACLLALALGAWLAVRSGGAPPPEDQPAAPLAAALPPRPTVAPPMAQPAPPRPPPAEAAPPKTLPAAQSEPPAPPVSTPLDRLPSDPFEPQEGQTPEIRTLVAVGDIQLGVVRDARIRDEPGLKKALVVIGDDLEKRSREPQQEGALGRQQVLDGYHEELGHYMDGEVEIRGPGWMIGIEVGPPPRREDWVRQNPGR